MDDAQEEVRTAAVQAAANVPSRIRRKQRTAHPLLKPYSDVPQYLKDNEFILTRYRSDYSLRDGVNSLFRIHNETGNVWTHLIGFFMFVGLTIYIVHASPAHVPFGHDQVSSLGAGVAESLHVVKDSMHSLQEHLHSHLHSVQTNVQLNLLSLQESLHAKVHALQDNVQHQVSSLQDGVHSLQDNLQHTASSLTHSLQDNLHQKLHNLQGHLQAVRTQLTSNLHQLLKLRTTRWPVYVYMAGAMVCLLVSSICHLLGCCSRHMAKLMWRMDYSGIAVLIVASFFPPVYYGFMCAPFWRGFYLTITSAGGAMAVAVSLLPLFQTPKYRPFRASMFAGLGVWGVVPLLHAWQLNQGVLPFQQAMLYDGIMGLVYLGGAAIYAARIPERWHPGAFDLVLHSHQIFHVAVVVAAVVHFRAVMILLKWRESSSSSCSYEAHTGTIAHMGHELQKLFHDFTAVEQVWEAFSSQLHLHLGAGDSV